MAFYVVKIKPERRFCAFRSVGPARSLAQGESEADDATNTSEVQSHQSHLTLSCSSRFFVCINPDSP